MKTYVIGAGGHAKVVLSTLQAAGIKVDGILDDDPQKQGLEIFGVRVVGTINEAAELGKAKGILAIGDNYARQLLAKKLSEWEWLTVVHPEAYVHPTARIGPGTVIFAGAIVQPDVSLGAHVIVNTGANVDHDCVVEDFVHLAPGVNLAGGIRIEEGTLIGVGAAVAPRVRIGAWTIVGAGAVVVKDLPSRVVAVGVPAKPLKPVRREGV